MEERNSRTGGLFDCLFLLGKMLLTVEREKCVIQERKRDPAGVISLSK